MNNGATEVNQEQKFNAIINAVVADLTQKIGQLAYDKALLQVENQELRQHVAQMQQQTEAQVESKVS